METSNQGSLVRQLQIKRQWLHSQANDPHASSQNLADTRRIPEHQQAHEQRVAQFPVVVWRALDYQNIIKSEDNIIWITSYIRLSSSTKRQQLKPMSNQNCINQSCMERCCNKAGYCIDYTSFNPSQNSCYYYYNGISYGFPYYIIPIVVVIVFFLIVSIVLCCLYRRRHLAQQQARLATGNLDTNNKIYMEGYTPGMGENVTYQKVNWSQQPVYQSGTPEVL